MGFFDYLILGVIALLLVVVVIYLIRQKKKGKCIGCGGDCSSCRYKNTSQKEK